MKTLIFLLISATMAVAQPIVVLPERFHDRQVVTSNSAEFKAIVSETKALKRQVVEEQKRVANIEAQVAKERRDKDERLQKLEAQAAKPKFGIGSLFLGILNIGTQFFLNPFGYMMRTLMGIVLGLVGIVVIYLILRFLWHRLKVEKK